jgi:hypothetical protein
MSDRPVGSRNGDPLQELNDVNARLREHSERVRYLNQVGRQISLIEGYEAGDLTIVFDLAPVRYPDEKWTMAGNLISVPRVKSRLILHNKIDNCKSLNQWKDQSVLIGDVESVNCPDGRIPSRVWLDLSKHEFVERGTGDIYLSLPQRRLKILDLFHAGEVGGRCDRARAEMFEGSHPSKVKGRVEIVERVSSYQPDLLANLIDFWKLIFNNGIPPYRVFLERGSITIWESASNGFQVADVLIGPLDFQSCITKQ